MTAVPVPYTPIGTPTTCRAPHNGANFLITEWKHANEYKGKIIYVHGFAESSSIYTEFFDRLSQAGYDIVFFDQRGAGETSTGSDYGKTNDMYAFDDLDFIIKREMDASPQEKFILMGHSMGGGIVLNYGIRGTFRDKIKVIVASGPMVYLHPKTLPNIVLRTLQPVINKLVPNLKIDSKLDVDYVTNNEKWKDYIRKGDTKFVGSVSLFNDMFERGKDLTKPNYVSKFSPNIAVLVAHGDTDYINNLQGSKDFFNLLPDTVEHKKFIEVKNARHSIFLENDDVLNPLIQQILDFIESSS